ncbi:unnamed protein product, partial [Staurois parvus]
MALGMTAGCPVRMSEKHLLFVIGPAASGICRVPGTALPFTKSIASCACALGTQLSCPRHYRSREDSARLDRGTGKIKEQLRGRAGTCQIQVPAPHLPKGQQSSV